MIFHEMGPGRSDSGLRPCTRSPTYYVIIQLGWYYALVIYLLISTSIRLYGLTSEYSFKIDQHNAKCYVWSSKTVFRINLNDCTQYTTCNKCMSARNPYCGWCAKSAKCLAKDKCSGLDDQWLDTHGQTCPQIENLGELNPKLNLYQRNELDIRLNFDLNHLRDDLKCVLLNIRMPNEVLSAYVLTNGLNKRIRCGFILDNATVHDDQAEFNLNLKLNNVYLIDAANSNKIFSLNKCKMYATCTTCMKNSCHWNNQLFKCDYFPLNKTSIVSCPSIDILNRTPIFVSYSQSDSIDSYRFQLNNFDLNGSLKLYCVFNGTVYREIKIISSQVCF
jgi:hypothetical protein